MDTDMTQGFDMTKVRPGEVALRTLLAVEAERRGHGRRQYRTTQEKPGQRQCRIPGSAGHRLSKSPFAPFEPSSNEPGIIMINIIS
jgi:hypothetical protein